MAFFKRLNLLRKMDTMPLNEIYPLFFKMARVFIFFGALEIFLFIDHVTTRTLQMISGILKLGDAFFLYYLFISGANNHGTTKNKILCLVGAIFSFATVVLSIYDTITKSQEGNSISNTQDMISTVTSIVVTLILSFPLSIIFAKLYIRQEGEEKTKSAGGAMAAQEV